MLDEDILLEFDDEAAEFDELEGGAVGELPMRQINLVADKGQSPVRIDKFLIDHLANTSRNKIQQAADAGNIAVNGKVVKSNYKVKPLDEIVITMNRPEYDSTIVPEDIPLDIVYEDDVLMVVNKPAGLVVHPGCGNSHGTLINAVAWHLKDNPSFDPNDPQVGLVHRIDKNTSGLLVVAKNDETHLALSEQLKGHHIRRTYWAVAIGNFKEDRGTVDAPIGRHLVDRKRMAIIRNSDYKSRDAITHWEVLARGESDGQCFTLVRCELETGRTHQIRVHMAHIGCPVAGDFLYGAELPELPGRFALHSHEIHLHHPITGEVLHLTSPLPQLLRALLV